MPSKWQLRDAPLVAVVQAKEQKSKIYCAASGIHDNQLHNNDTNDTWQDDYVAFTCLNWQAHSISG